MILCFSTENKDKKGLTIMRHVEYDTYIRQCVLHWVIRPFRPRFIDFEQLYRAFLWFAANGRCLKGRCVWMQAVKMEVSEERKYADEF